MKLHRCTKRVRNNRGFSILELILVVAIFSISAFASAGVVVQGYRATRLGAEQTIATQYAAEGIEAVKSIKNQGYYKISNTAGTGVIKDVNNVWAFSGSNNVFDKYTRIISVSDVRRDGSGNIVPSGGTVDRDTKDVTSTVSWNFGPGRNDSVVATTYLSNWEGLKGGVLVYGDGGTTTDAVRYKLLDPVAGTWSSSASTADVDGSSTNRALRAAKVYASATRNEKILVSRHYNGTTQYIYVQVYNGSAGTWGNVVLLSNWNATTFLDVQNFDGTYLNNGDFMVVYSDNTRLPKFRVWNGSTWSASSISMQNLATGGIPTFIVAKARPGTNEVMAAFFNQASDSATEYFNGGSYVQGSWATAVTHGSNAPLTTKRFVDFDWSSNDATRGAVVFTNSTTDKSIRIKIWTANGSGGGSWSSAAATTAQTNNIGALSVAGRKGANEFIACDKDAGATPAIRCYESSFTPAFTNPTNQVVASATDTGIQRSYHMDFEANSGDPGLVVYSDNTAVPKLKKYATATNTFDSSATSISTSPFTLGVVKTIRVVHLNLNDDVMFLVADANLDLYSVIWSGANNAVYATPAGKAFNQHGTNGSAALDYWYDFAWDEY